MNILTSDASTVYTLFTEFIMSIHYQLSSANDCISYSYYRQQ